MRLDSDLGKWSRDQAALVSCAKARIPRSPLGQIPIAMVKRTTKLPDPGVLVSAAELSEVVALSSKRSTIGFDAGCRRASVGGHTRPVEA